MEVGAACAAAGAAGLHLAGYNRANYFENLHLKQSRNFRKQQIVHSQADLFRADVEQAIGASSAVQDRLIVVSALLLGVTAHTNGWNMAANTRSFLQDVFYLCIGNAFLYFLVSLIASISANILARKCQKELLNNCVRPPFAEMMRDVDLAAELESAEAFERQGVSQVLRIPGADQLAGQKSEDEVWSKNGTSSSTNASMAYLIEQQISNELTFMEMQHDWDELQTYTPYFLVWGLRSLLNSFGFFALSHTYRAQKPYGFQVHIFYVIIVAGLSFISERLMATSRRVFAVELCALILCHVLCFYVACKDRDINDREEMDFNSFNVYVLVAYLAQLVTSAIAQFRFAANAQNLEPTQGAAEHHTSAGLCHCPTLTREDSNFSLTSNEWSMAPELASAIRSESFDLKSTKTSKLSRSHHSQNDVLNQRWQHLSFVRVYVRKFCIFAGWAVIAIWFGAVIFQTGRVVTSTQRTEIEFKDPSKTRRLDFAGTDDVVTIALEVDGERRMLRDLKTKTVAQVLEDVAPLTLWQQLQGKRLAARDGKGVELSGLLPLESVEQLSIHVEDPL